MAEEKEPKGIFREEMEKILKMYQDSKHNLDDKMKKSSGASQEEEGKTAGPKKLRQVSSRMTLAILKKQINIMNKEISEGKLSRARSRTLVIDNLVSTLKEP